MATFAPSAARRLAMAAPIPRDPPVMSAIFPSSFFDIVLLLLLAPSIRPNAPLTFAQSAGSLCCAHPKRFRFCGHSLQLGSVATTGPIAITRIAGVYALEPGRLFGVC